MVMMARSVDGTTPVPLIGYPRTAGLPAISVHRWTHPGTALPVPGVHAHDFLVLIYLEEGDHTVRVDGRDRALTTGDAFVIAPGTVVEPTRSPATADVRTWVVFFPADAVDPAAPTSLVSWRMHPLLSLFVGGARSGGQHLRVP